MSTDEGKKRGLLAKIFLAKPPRHEHPPEIIEAPRPKKPVPEPEATLAPVPAAPVATPQPPEPVAAPVPDVPAAAERVSEPVPVEPVAEVAVSEPEPASAPAPEPVPGPVAAAEPVVETVSEPEPEPQPEPAAPEPEIVAAAPEPVPEAPAVAEAVPEPVAVEPAPAEPVADVAAPKPEPAAELTSEPEPVAESEPVVVAEPVAAPAPVAPEAPSAAADEPAPAEPAPEKSQTPEPVFAPTVSAAAAPVDEAKGFIARLKRGLSRTSGALAGGITALFTKRKLDAATLQDLEDLLIQADLGVETSMAIAERLSKGRHDRHVSDEEVRKVLAEEIEAVLTPVAKPLVITPSLKPQVILVVGVNGTGKTTTIGKLAARLTRTGKSVTMVAGDTFRAAAIEQLKVWGARAGARVVSRAQGADAAGLVFDAMAEAKTDGTDVLLVDTAGRLQNRAELMAELEKVIRVIRKQDPTAPHDVLLVLDATTGQNAMTQVEVFGRSAGVTGLVMTKLDGTARGGILVAISARHSIPVHLIGVGETVEDLAPFDPRAFGRAIAGLD